MSSLASRWFVCSFLTLAALGSACGSETRQTYDGDASTTSGGASGGPGASSGNFEPGTSSGSGVGVGNTVVTGKTFAPNGSLPLSGVLVYVLDAPPEPIPDHVYCDSCRELAEGSFALSNADGSFQLRAHAGTRYVVTEKGQFRRVRQVEIGEDGTTTELSEEITTLPSRTGEGDTVPKIAVLDSQGGDYDDIVVALQGLGIAEWTDFDGDKNAINTDNLAKFHIVMLPCLPAGFPSNMSGKYDALRDFVQKGGKVYASDRSANYVDQPFKQFFKSANVALDSENGARTPLGRYDDEGLRAWLAVVSPQTNLDDARFDGVWSSFTGVKPAEVPGPEGGTVTVTPKVWASVDDSSFYSKEAAVSFAYGCGRSMLSIFHVHGGTSTQLTAQEMALLYMLLDVSTCAGTPGVGVVN